MDVWSRYLTCLLMLALPACGGAPAGDPGGTTPKPDEDAIYKIGGELTGHLYGVVALRLNDGEELKLYQNGKFTFTTKLAGNKSYQVELAGVASTQTCALQNAAGAVAYASIANIKVACQQRLWHKPQQANDLFASAATGIQTPEVASNKAGEALVVWQQKVGVTQHIFRAELIDGNWHLPATEQAFIDPSAYQKDASMPRVALSDSGYALIIWVQETDGKNQVFRSERIGGSWHDPVNLSDNISPDNGHCTDPQVAVDAQGNAVVIWQQTRDGKEQVYLAYRRAESGEWTYPADIKDHLSIKDTNAVSPRVAIAGGEAVVVWHQAVSAGGTTQIYKASLSFANSDISKPKTLNDSISPKQKSATRPSIAGAQNGALLIAWTQKNNSDKVMTYKAERDADGKWIFPSISEFISPASVAAVSGSVRVALDAQNNALVGWNATQGSGKNRIYLSEKRAGIWRNPTESEFFIQAFPDAELSALAMDNSGDKFGNTGNAIVVWHDVDDVLLPQVFVSEYRQGKWSHPQSKEQFFGLGGFEASKYSNLSLTDDGRAYLVTLQKVSGANFDLLLSGYY